MALAGGQSKKEAESVNYTDKEGNSTMIHIRKWERHRTQPWVTEDAVKRHTEKLWFTPEDREKTLEKIKKKKEKEAEEERKAALGEPEAKDDAEPDKKRKKAREMAAPAEVPTGVGKLPIGVE